MDKKEYVLVHPLTGEIRSIKNGFSWTCLLWSWFFGIPLFIRKLYIWGVVMIVLQFSYISGEDGSNAFMGLVILVLSVVLGFKGNEWAVKGYLAKGWTLATNIHIQSNSY